MTHQEIKELAGHRAVSPWIMKLVNDAIAIERKAVYGELADKISKMPFGDTASSFAAWIRMEHDSVSMASDSAGLKK